MPQTPMCKGFEACHVNRLSVFAQKTFSFLCLIAKNFVAKNFAYFFGIICLSQINVVSLCRKQHKIGINDESF